MTDVGPVSVEAEQEAPSRVDDYIDIFVSPGQVFVRRTAEEWVQPFVVLLIVSVVLYIVSLPANTVAMQAAAASNPQAAEAMQRMGGILRLVNGIIVPVAVAVLTLLIATGLWLAARAFDVPVGFKGALLVAVFSGFIGIPQSLARTASILLSNRDGVVDMTRDASFGILRFWGSDASPVLQGLLSRFDIFTIWQAAIWAIGLAVLGKVSKGRGIAAAALIWLLAAVPVMVFKMIAPGQ